MELLDIAVVVGMMGVIFLVLKSLAKNRNKDEDDK